MLEEAERSVHDALCAVKRALESASVVPGGRDEAYLDFTRDLEQAAEAREREKQMTQMQAAEAQKQTAMNAAAFADSSSAPMADWVFTSGSTRGVSSTPSRSRAPCSLWCCRESPWPFRRSCNWCERPHRKAGTPPSPGTPSSVAVQRSLPLSRYPENFSVQGVLRLNDPAFMVDIFLNRLAESVRLCLLGPYIITEES